MMAKKEINRGALKNTLNRVWQTEGKSRLSEMGRNAFLIELSDLVDKRRIMHGRPWSFDKFLICLQDCEGIISPKDMQFSWEPF